MTILKPIQNFLFTAAILLAFGDARAQDVPPGGHFPKPILLAPAVTKDSIHLGQYLSVFVDKSAAMTLETVQAQAFLPYDSLRLAGKYERGRYAYWFRFSTKNTGADTLQMLLNAGHFDTVQVFTNSGGQWVGAAITGKLVPHKFQSPKREQPISHLIMLRIPPGPETVYWLRVRDFCMTYPPAPVLIRPMGEAGFFFQAMLPTYVWNACFLGILIFMLVNTLIYWLRIGDRSYLFYAGYILAHFLFFLRGMEFNNLFQHPFPHLFPTWALQYKFRTPVAWAWAIFYLLFLETFFDAKRRMPQLHRWLKIGMALLLTALFFDRVLAHIDPVLAWKWSGIFANGMRVSCTVFLVAMIRNYRKDPLAKFILSGTIFYAAGSIGTGLDSENSPFWDRTLLWNQLGILAELLFFNLGLAVRARLVKEEKDLALLENQKLLLEKELEQARVRSMVALDIHDEVGAGLTKLSLSAQLAVRLPGLSEANLRERIAQMGVAAQEVAGQLRNIVFATNPDFDRFEEMQGYFRENAREFWANSGVEVVFDFETNGDSPVVPPNVKRQLLLIFKEAQNNAAKHAGARNVWLTFKLDGADRYLLEVRDDGNGFDAGGGGHFTKGMSGMRKRAESIGADFQVVSEKGKGSSVRVAGGL